MLLEDVRVEDKFLPNATFRCFGLALLSICVNELFPGKTVVVGND